MPPCASPVAAVATSQVPGQALRSKIGRPWISQLFETADERRCTRILVAAHPRQSACICASLPRRYGSRSLSLASLETRAEDAFDRLAHLAARLCRIRND